MFNNNVYTGLLFPLLYAIQASFRCSQKRLTKIPQEIWTNVTKLDLSHNDLNLSHPETLRALQRFENLVHLNLSANYLPLLVRGSLSSLPSLEVLDLSRCQLAELERGAFEGLPRLQKLFLGHNRLQGSVATALKELTGVLSYLDLQGNPRLSFTPFDGPKGARRAFRFKGSKPHVHEHIHEGLCYSVHLRQQHIEPKYLCDNCFFLCITFSGFEEKRISGKLNHRKLLAEEPLPFTTSPTPNTTFNGERSPLNTLTTMCYIKQWVTSPFSPTDTTSGRVPAHNWQFLLGLLVTAITLSIAVAVLAKCKLLHRYVSSYRHSRLTNSDSVSQYDPEVYEVGFAPRGGAATISNGIGDNDEDEEEGVEEDDDGFIEDNYIQPSERERASRALEHQEREEEEDEEEEEEEEDEDELEFTIG